MRFGSSIPFFAARALFLSAVLVLGDGCGDGNDTAGGGGSGGSGGGGSGGGGGGGSGGSGGGGGNPGSLPIATWGRSAILYHVYVRSFVDSDGDGHGDFAGLTAKLPYIQSLGVDGILMLPIVQGDHDVYGGYAPTDYLDTESSYGDLAAFDALVGEAQSLGLRVMIDMPFDTCSDTHPYFIEARADPASPKHDFYVWTDAPCPDVSGFFGAPAWNLVPEIGRCYWAKYAADVPEWNYDEPDVRAMMADAARFWLDRGVSGFRFDSAPSLRDQALTPPILLGTPETHAALAELQAAVKAKSPGALSVAEVFDGSQQSLEPYYADGFDMVFDYPIYLGGLYQALSTGDAAALRDAIREKLLRVPEGRMGGLFLGNHDVPGEPGRSADVLGHDPVLLTQAAALLFSLPGTPFVYYGEEIGLPAGAAPGGTLYVRNPMQWDGSPGRGFTQGMPWAPFANNASIHVAAQDGAPGSTLETYRGLIQVRQLALTDGAYQELSTADPRVFAHLREGGGERVLCLFNFDAAPHPAAVDLASIGIQSASVTDRIFQFSEAGVTPQNASAYGPELPAHGVRWLALD